MKWRETLRGKLRLLSRLLTLLPYVFPFRSLGFVFVMRSYSQHFSPGTTDKTSKTSQAFDKLEQDVSLKTQGAVDEGKRDVHDAAVVGGSYLGAAIDTVKV